MRYSELPDAELVAGCLAGDNAAWDTLIARYQSFIFALALRHGLSHADADDLFQDVCLKLYRHLGELREVRRLSSWLAAMVRQELWGRWRRHESLLLGDLAEAERLPAGYDERRTVDPEDVVLALERENLVRAALLNIGGECQRLLDLLYGPEPAAYSEVAARLEMPLGSVGPRRARCLERLRKKLSEFGY